MPMETIRLSIDAELLREIDEAARRRGISRSELVCEALRDYLKAQRSQDSKKVSR